MAAKNVQTLWRRAKNRLEPAIMLGNALADPVPKEGSEYFRSGPPRSGVDIRGILRK